MKISEFGFIVLVILILLVSSCSNSVLNCDACSSLPGLDFEKIDHNKYEFDLHYPVGIGMGELFEPHFELQLTVCQQNGKLIACSPTLKNNSVIFDFKEKFSVSNKLLTHNRELYFSIDTAFVVGKGEKVYKCRIKGMWNKNYDNPMGDDFVMFLTNNGVTGMYVSSVGENIYIEGIKEYVYAPIGEIYYLWNKEDVFIKD